MHQSPYQSMSAVIEQMHRGICRYGFTGCVCRVASLAGQWLVGLTHTDQRHVWYYLNLSHERPLIMLPAELEFVRAGTDELPYLEQLPTIGLFEADGGAWRLTVIERIRDWFAHELDALAVAILG